MLTKNKTDSFLRHSVYSVYLKYMVPLFKRVVCIKTTKICNKNRFLNALVPAMAGKVTDFNWLIIIYGAILKEVCIVRQSTVK
jgi:hypothetical protein